MSQEKIRETILRLVPADGSPIGNGKMQTLLAEAGHRISEESYFIVRDRLIDEGKLKTGRGRGGSILRVADGAAAAPRGGEPAPATRAAAKQKGPVQKRAPKMAMPIIKRRRSALKKSELYSSLWTLCDELRGGMDASQYKDYVLVLLFVKYVSDKYAGQRYAPITIPPGASFADMVSLKGSKEIGDDINKRIIGPLARANKLSDMPDFNDDTKLGSGKEKVERLTNLIAIFENPALDFSRNRADGDDILGDAYEYLMRHFATESGKSKGQFYTPAEVSRIMAQILGIRGANTGADTTVYDPTCGSGSLLLKVGDEAGTAVTLYGQEKDAATSGLARMNMILHDNPTALVRQGNTLTDPKYLDGDALKTFDYVVANPPFSDKRWSTGLDAEHDPHHRFEAFGIPPAKQGDYAYLLHIVRSLKSTGRGCCILPHGVLFRGNAEAAIRRNLVRKGYIQGIIGLPANLFYGTGIPACIVVIDKAGAQARKGIFMVDASQGFSKDGPKNRLRSQDIHKIVDVFTKAADVPRYARMVPMSEIERNDYNLNLPRYIDSQTAEDLQDIDGHLNGGIPQADIDALQPYWELCPGLRSALFTPLREGYLALAVEPAAIRSAIFDHPEFATFLADMRHHFAHWQSQQTTTLKALAAGCQPKEIIANLSESLLAHYQGQPLVDPYDCYQRLMDYWAETMQDDCYLIAADGWLAEPYRVIEVKQGKNGKPDKEVDKGWACDLAPKPLIVARYFASEQAAIDSLQTELEAASAALTEFEEEHSGEDGPLSELDKINKATVKARLKELDPGNAPGSPPGNAELQLGPGRQPPGNAELQLGPGRQPRSSVLTNASRITEAPQPSWSSASPGDTDERTVLEQWLALSDQESELKRQIKDAEAELDILALSRYESLTEDEIKALVVDDKWMAALAAAVQGEMDRLSQRLTGRVKELGERYGMTMPAITARVAELEGKVAEHLRKMGFVW